MSGRLILVRHGQTHANVERRLDTRPPGAELTELGRDQSRVFARSGLACPGLLLHSVAVRAAQTAGEIAGELGLNPAPLEGIHEVQAGDLEDRSDDDAIAQYRAVYRRWHEGDLDAAMPGGETGRAVLDRCLPAIELAMELAWEPGLEPGLEEERSPQRDGSTGSDVVVVSHGSAIRLVAAELAGVDSGFAVDHPLANLDAVVLQPVEGRRWRCVRWGSRTPPLGRRIDAQSVEGALEATDTA